MMKRVLAVGIPSGIQQSIISLSNVIVQSKHQRVRFRSHGRIRFLFQDRGLYHAAPADHLHVGHHIYRPEHRAKKYDRVKKGIIQGMTMSAIYTVVVSVVLYTFGGTILKIFSSDLDVIQFGQEAIGSSLPSI